MNRTTFDKLVGDTVKATADLMVSKGAEYAGDSDRLINFKRNAEKQGTTPLQIWKQYIGKHIDSLDTYFHRVHDRAIEIALSRAVCDFTTNQEHPPADVFRRYIHEAMPGAMEDIDRALSEPIEGRFHDIINYCYLGLALVKETRDAKETP